MIHRPTQCLFYASSLALPPNPNPILIKPNPGKTLDRDFYMDAHQAAAWGIVDEVIDMRSDATFIKE
jgi:hypothetical protein